MRMPSRHANVFALHKHASHLADLHFLPFNWTVYHHGHFMEPLHEALPLLVEEGLAEVSLETDWLPPTEERPGRSIAFQSYQLTDLGIGLAREALEVTDDAEALLHAIDVALRERGVRSEQIDEWSRDRLRGWVTRGVILQEDAAKTAAALSGEYPFRAPVDGLAKAIGAWSVGPSSHRRLLVHWVKNKESLPDHAMHLALLKRLHAQGDPSAVGRIVWARGVVTSLLGRDVHGDTRLRFTTFPGGNDEREIELCMGGSIPQDPRTLVGRTVGIVGVSAVVGTSLVLHVLCTVDGESPVAPRAGPTHPSRSRERVAVFVSSTWHDMQPERTHVRETLARMKGAEFLGMEPFSSRPETPRERSLATVSASKVYVGIIGSMYGSGITEAEYDLAFSLGIPCFIYFRDPDVPVAPRFVETGDGARKLDAFKAKLRSRHLCATYRTPEELAARVLADLHEEICDSDDA